MEGYPVPEHGLYGRISERQRESSEKSAGKRKNFRLPDRQSEYMILGLRLTEGISLAGFRKPSEQMSERSGPECWKNTRGTACWKRLPGRLKFTGEGISLSNVVLAEFLAGEITEQMFANAE